MTDEEKKAVEFLKAKMTNWRKYIPEDKELHAEDIALNLIQKQESEIKKLKNVIDRMAECIFILRCWAITSQDDIPKLKQKIIEEFMKESEQHGRKENQNK